jgi:hypothetical protein
MKAHFSMTDKVSGTNLISDYRVNCHKEIESRRTPDSAKTRAAAVASNGPAWQQYSFPAPPQQFSSFQLPVK